MNEIYKFRAWDKKNKKMVKNIGFYQDKIIYPEWALEDIKYFEIMQDTGLKDKNGKAICEGDIVKMDEEAKNAPNQNLVVERYWCDYYLRPTNDRMYICTLSEGCADNIGNYKHKHGLAGVIIGNIYENSDLINS